MEDPYILVYEKKLSGLQEFLPLLEAVVQTAKPLVIIARMLKAKLWQPSSSTSYAAASRLRQ